MASDPKNDDLPTAVRDHICHAIYSVNHAMTRAYRPHLEKLSLTYPQYLVLTALWETDNQTVGMLCDTVLLETNTVTPLIKRLVDLGHVTKTRSKTDERQVLIQLTTSGQDMKSRAPDVTACIIKATGFELDRVVALRDMLIQVRENLKSS